MKQRKYDLHSDFKGFQLFTFSNLKLTPFKLKVINSFIKLSNNFEKNNPDILIKKTKIKGYQSGEVSLTIYEPKHITKPLPCLIFLHGGAFMLKDLGYMRQLASGYALGAHCKVIFMHHRLVPEYSFPTALEDSYRCLLWTYKNAAKLEIDRDRIAVAGDSSGGAIAIGLTHLTRDRKGPAICYQMLVYPVTDHNPTSESMKSFYNSPFWNSNLNKQMWQYYLKDENIDTLGYASPLNMNNFKALPNAYVEVEEYDCLRDEGIAYAKILEKHGYHVQFYYGKGMFHLFDMFQSKPSVKAVMKIRCNALIEGFSHECN